jgi:2-aminoethylphosphonate-pyruvate transaminase
MIIFSPGPSNISARVRNALLAPDICHRDEEFTALLASVRRRVLDVAGVSTSSGYASVVLGGSGSVAVESIAAAARPAGKMLVVSNGPYGERAAAMARYHGGEVHEWKLGWGDEVRPDRLESELAASGAKSLYLVHHETATGRLNDLRTLAAVGKARGCLVLADTVSSIAGEELDVIGSQIDAVVGSANKCIRGVPGAAFVIASEEFLEVAARQRAMHYSNLGEHFAAESRGETPFTPPVQVMYAFHEALGETLDEGVPQRIAHYKSLMRLMQTRLAAMGVNFLLPIEAYGSTLISCELPAGHSYDSLHRAMKQQGFVIYAAQGALKSRAFRLGLIGHFGIADVTAFLDALEAHLQS